MGKKLQEIRKRYFFAVEGEGEESFIKLIQNFSDEQKLFIHTIPCDLKGGDYKSMLKKAIKERAKKDIDFINSFLLVDTDVNNSIHEKWTINKLRIEAQKNNFILICQKPNIEGVFARMFAGNETKEFNKVSAKEALIKKWPDYEKPEDTMALRKKFTLKDIYRMAKHDKDMKELLEKIGFKIE